MAKPEDVDAAISLAVKKFGGLEDADMLRTFNMGVGITAVVRKEFAEEAMAHIKAQGIEAYEVGAITEGNKTVQFTGELNWN